MFRFQKEQKTYRIGEINIGGQPGRRPPLLIGSVFYPGHTLVLERRKGLVDMKMLKQKTTDAENAARDLGIGHATMAYVDTCEGAHRLLAASADATSGPLFIDSPSTDVKLRCLEAIEEMGCADRAVYNSLHLGSDGKEWSSLKEHGVSSAVILAFDPGDVSVKGRIHLLENGGRLSSNGLIDKALANGVTQPLIDMAATSYQQQAGAALRALTVAKAKWGLPCGLALHNTVETWPPFGDMDDGKKALFRYVDVASAATAVATGADWVMYGAIEASIRVAHAVAFTSEVMAQAVEDIW